MGLMSACTTLTEAFSGSQMIPVITTQKQYNSCLLQQELKTFKLEIATPQTAYQNLGAVSKNEAANFDNKRIHSTLHCKLIFNACAFNKFAMK